MLNIIWLLLLTAGLVTAAFTGRWAEVTAAALGAAKTGAELGLGLVGVMAVWLGLSRLMEKSGLLQGLVALARPLTRLLMPDVPRTHAAHGAVALNLIANLLGLDRKSVG